MYLLGCIFPLTGGMVGYPWGGGTETHNVHFICLNLKNVIYV